MFYKVSELLNHQGRTGLIARAMVGSIGLRMAGMGLGFLVGILLARGLGPAGYGIYGVAMSILSILMLPTEFGLPQLVTREVASLSVQQRVADIAHLLGWCVKFVTVTSLLIALVLLPLVLVENNILQSDLKAPLLWGFLFMILVAISNILSAALRGFHQIVAGQISEIIIRPAILVISLAIILIFYGNSALSPSMAIAFNVFAAFIGCTYAIIASRRYVKLDGSSGLLGSNPKAWLAGSMPLALGDGMRILSGHLAILLMGFMATREEVGLYRVAFGIYTVATLPSALLNAVCSPMISTFQQEGNRSAIQRLSVWMAVFLVASAFLFILPFLFSGQWIVSLVFGPAYAAAAQILLILLAGELIASLFGHSTIILNMLHYEKIVVQCSVMAIIVNAIICLLLIPKFGAVGGAIGVSLSQIVWRASATLYAKKSLGLDASIMSFFKNGLS